MYGMLKKTLNTFALITILGSVHSIKAEVNYTTSLDPSLLKSPYSNWGVDASNKGSINIQEAWKDLKPSKDVVVAIIDTGIDPNHPFLKENIYSLNGAVSPTNYGKDFSKGAKNINTPNDDHGHGTHIAGIIKLVFPKVKILPLKYYNRQATGQENLDSTIKALRFAVDSNVDIINYSGGGPEPALEELRILKEAESKGILVVAAAGNEEANIDNKKNAYYPASYRLKNTISVAAHDENQKLIALSNYGIESVDVSAPGERIRSSYPASRAGFLSGTSQATAFVTGTAALIKSKYPNMAAAQIKTIIKDSAVKMTELAGKIATGGKVDAYQALKMADSIEAAKTKRAIATTNKSSKKDEGVIYFRKAK